MKLKEAKKIAKELGFNYVAVDKDKDKYIYAYEIYDGKDNYQWLILNGLISDCIGIYTGKKDWKDTWTKC